MSAAAPLTSGAAKLVPESIAISPPGNVEPTHTEGAEMSMGAP